MSGVARVMGADVAAGAWVGLLLDVAEPGAVTAVSAVTAVTAVTAPDVTGLLAASGPVDVLALDIPIGLPDAGPRRADAVARALVGARAASVFTTPVRAALQAPDHAEAVRLSRAATGHGVSAQAFALRHKVLEVDRWWRSAPRGAPRLVEAHPEVSFAAMAGGAPTHRKKSWAGAGERRALLRSAGVEVPDDLGEAGRVGAVDDVLDAAALAWTARRVARGQATSHPDPPEPMPDGWRAAIWA